MSDDGIQRLVARDSGARGPLRPKTPHAARRQRDRCAGRRNRHTVDQASGDPHDGHMKQLTLAMVALAVTLAALAAPAVAKPKPLTPLGIDLALEGTTIANSELTSVVRAAQVNLNQAASTLDGP